MHSRTSSKAALLLVLSLSGAPALAQSEPEPSGARDELRSQLELRPGGLTADSAAARAVKVAPQVDSAEAAAEQAASAANLGKVGFAPRLDLSAGYTRLSRVDQPPFEFAGMSFDNPFPQILDIYTTQARVSVPVSDYFLTIWPQYDAAQDAADAARYQIQVEREQVATRAREAFYGYVRARAFVVVARDAVALLEAHVSDLEALVGAGQATRADAMQARAQLAEAQVQLASSQGAVTVAASSLRRLLDLPPDQPIHIGEDAFAPIDTEPTAADELLDLALRQRPEVRALRSLLGARENTVDAQKGARWPRLSIFGTLDYLNPNQRVIPQDERFSATWNVGVSLSWSPNDFVGQTVRVGGAELDVIRAKNDLRLVEDQIAIEAAQAASELQVALEAVASAQQGLEAAREAWRSRRDLFGVGEALASDVLDAESALRRAEITQIDAYIRARLAEARMRRVIGRAAATSD